MGVDLIGRSASLLTFHWGWGSFPFIDRFVCVLYPTAQELSVPKWSGIAKFLFPTEHKLVQGLSSGHWCNFVVCQGNFSQKRAFASCVGLSEGYHHKRLDKRALLCVWNLVLCRAGYEKIARRRSTALFRRVMPNSRCGRWRKTMTKTMWLSSRWTGSPPTDSTRRHSHRAGQLDEHCGKAQHRHCQVSEIRCWHWWMSVLDFVYFRKFHWWFEKTSNVKERQQPRNTRKECAPQIFKIWKSNDKISCQSLEYRKFLSPSEKHHLLSLAAWISKLFLNRGSSCRLDAVHRNCHVFLFLSHLMTGMCGQSDKDLPGTTASQGGQRISSFWIAHPTQRNLGRCWNSNETGSKFMVTLIRVLARFTECCLLGVRVNYSCFLLCKKFGWTLVWSREKISVSGFSLFSTQEKLETFSIKVACVLCTGGCVDLVLRAISVVYQTGKC